MGGRTAVLAGVLVWAGALAGRSATGDWPLALLALVPVSGLLSLRLPGRPGGWLTWLALASAACARGAGHEALVGAQRAAVERSAGFFHIEGRVTEPPPREAGEPVAAVEVRCSQPALIAGTRLRVRLPAGDRSEWGDRVRAAVRVEPARGVRVPGGFDASAAATAAGLAASGRAFTIASRPGRGGDALPRATVARWRRGIEGVLERNLGPAARELVVPLVIGDRTALTPELDSDLKAAGLIHLLALSGLHVVWLASVARGVVGALGGGVSSRALASAGCALLYAGLAGPLPSLLRAALHECLLAVATLRGRTLDPLQALALSALALLAVAPGWAADLGFQLSYAATFGLIAFTPWLLERAGRGRAWASPFIPTLSAQASALPVLLARFHAVSWVGALANLAGVPISGLLLAAAWLGTLADLLLPGSGALLFSAAELLAAALREVAGQAGRFPGALSAAGHEAGLPLCAAGGVLLLALSLPRGRALEERLRPRSFARQCATLVGTVLLGTALLGMATVRPLRPPPGGAWFVVLDVGQGDALACTWGRGWWLVDTGPATPSFDAGARTVLPFLRWAGVRRLEWMLLSHDDSDHSGGAQAVARGVAVLREGAPESCARVRLLRGAGAVRSLARGDTLSRCPPVAVLWPPIVRRAQPGASAGSDNAASLVLEFGTPAGGILAAGDVDLAVEDSLAPGGRIVLLKVAHHGSSHASGAEFLGRVRPEVAAISVGVRNRFGHPDAGVLARLGRAGVSVHRTDLEGTLWFECSGGGIRLLDWRRPAPRPGRTGGDACASPRPLPER